LKVLTLTYWDNLKDISIILWSSSVVTVENCNAQEKNNIILTVTTDEENGMIETSFRFNISISQSQNLHIFWLTWILTATSAFLTVCHASNKMDSQCNKSVFCFKQNMWSFLTLTYYDN